MSRPTFTFDFARTKQLDPRLSFSRSSTATYFDQNGILRTAPANEPRFDHDPATGRSLGLLIERSRTNLLTYSEQCDNAAWTKTAGSITANATTAPDGASTADKFVEDTANSSHLLRQNVTLSGSTAYTSSVWAKAAGRSIFTMLVHDGANFRSAHFDLTAGTVTTAGTTLAGSEGIVACPNGWYRCYVTATTGASPSSSYTDYRMSDGSPTNSGDTYTGDGSSGIYFWGAQVEAATFASSYIQTTNATVTRNVDTCTNTGLIGLFNQGQFSVVIAGAVMGVGEPSIYPPIWSVDDGTANNQALIFFADPTTDILQQKLTTASSTVVASNSAAAITAQTQFAVAAAYKTNDFAFCKDGVAAVTDGAGTLPTSFTTLRVGADVTQRWHGWLGRVLIYPTRLSNSILKELSR